jgi:type I restriction enzyme, S subunit
MKTLKLPADWKLVPLAAVADVQTGLALGKEAAKDPVRLPYLRVANVQDGYLDLSEIKEVEIERSLISRYSLRTGDVLMTEGGDFDKLGRGYIWQDEVPNCLHQNHVFVVRPHKELLPYFLTALTSSDYGRRYFQSCSKQSTNLASINSSQLKAFPVPLPTVQEQGAIRAVISAWDCGIRQLTNLIAAKLRFKQWLMQQLLTGQRRFPGFKDEWQQVLLRDVTTECDERNRGQLGTESVKAVTKAEGIVPMRERTIGADIGRYLIVRKDWFAYNPMRINIGSIARWSGENDVLVSPDYVVFRCNHQSGKLPGIEPDYLDHLRRSGIWEKYVTAAGNGSVRVRIYYSDLGHLKFSLPDRKEQRRIADVLNAADREICLLLRELDTLKQQKKGLMQKLLTGQVRVKHK